LPPWRKRRRGVWLGAVAAVAAIAAFAAPRYFAEAPVPVLSVTAKPAERVLAVTGRIRARESVQVVPRVAGQVRELTRREGESVVAGEVLGRIDDAKARAALAQTVAAAEAQRRTLAQAERDLDRATALRSRGTVTEAAVENAALAVSRGREDLRRLSAAADEARLRLEEHQILAPLTGRLLTRPVDPGQVVDGRTTIFEIAPTGDREVETEVDETYSTEVALGQPARLQFPGSGGVIEGRVSYLSPRIDTATGGRVVRLAYPETAQELPVGLTVDVNIVVERRDGAIMVPRTAIRDAATAPAVQVVRDGKVATQAIAFKDWPSATVMVTEGLKAGDQVIVGAHQVEGAAVKTTVASARPAAGRPPGRP
jgi:HlyD family secretion protein